MTIILVTGATGQQGGAVIDALCTSKTFKQHTIRALTRNPASKAARSLAERGIQIVQGDLEHKDGLQNALAGVEAAYLVTDFRGKNDVAGEVEQGKTFIACAQQSGTVKHIIFSSVCGAERAVEVDHFHSKFEIEEMLRKSSIKWTILRPTSFMENIPREPGIARFMFLSYMYAMFGQDDVYHIAARDIGAVATNAIFEPKSYEGKIINLVGELANVDSMQQSLDRVEGFTSWRIWIPQSLALMVTPYHFRQMFKVCLGIVMMMTTLRSSTHLP